MVDDTLRWEMVEDLPAWVTIRGQLIPVERQAVGVVFPDPEV